MRNRYKSALCITTALSVGILALGFAAPAAAQTAAPDETMGTVVVTARRADERLQEVPISISVFNQQALTNANVVTAADLAKMTPSLQANNGSGSDNSNFSIRGFNQIAGTAPTVGVYFADVVAPRGLANNYAAGDGAGPGSFFDLANVQVLKGPQGTLFGRNTTGGDVLLVPQKPTGRNEGYVEASYGNYDMRRVEAVVNLPIADTVRLRLGVDHQVRDGYLNNESGIGPTHLDNVNYTALRASLVVDLTPNLENYTVFSFTKSRNNGDVQKIAAGTGSGLLQPYAVANAAATPGYYDVMQGETNPESFIQQYQIVNTTTWNATDNLTVKNIFSYAELEDRDIANLFGLVANVPTAYGTYAIPFTEVRAVAGGYIAHESTTTDEFHVQGRAFNDRLTWQAGAYAEISLPLGGAGTQGVTFGSCINDAALQCNDPLGSAYAAYGVHIGSAGVSTVQASTYDYGLYGQGTYKVTDQIKLTAGYRYTWDRSAVEQYSRSYYLEYPPYYGTTGSFCTQPQTATTGCIGHIVEDSSRPTWMIDLDYTPIQDLLIYGKYSRGYRAGGIADSVTPPANIFAPEKLDSYEAGFKATFHKFFNSTLDASVFYNDFVNQQIQVGFNATQPGYGPTAAPINIPRSTIYGAEINASINPFKGFVVTVGYSYLHTRIDDIGDVNSLVIPGYQTSASFKVGDPITNTPENKAVVDVGYQLPFVPIEMGKVTVGGTYSYTDKQLANYVDGTPAGIAAGFGAYAWLPATNLLDLHVTWSNMFNQPVDLSLFGTNVTGQKYFSAVSGLGTTGLGIEAFELGQPTMYGVRLKYHWGR